jgi:hypothetical protein
MAYLDRSAMDHLGSALRPEYDLVVTSPVTKKHRDLLFQYALAETSVGAERGSREARLRLRERGAGSAQRRQGSISTIIATYLAAFSARRASAGVASWTVASLRSSGP